MLGLVAIAEVAISSLASGGGATYNESIAFTGTSTYSAISSGIFTGIGTYSGVATFSPISTASVKGLIGFDGVGLWNATPIQSLTGSAAWTGTGAFNAITSGIFKGLIAWNASGLFYAASRDAYEAYLDGLRELSADFTTPPSAITPIGLSTILRPDAITFDLHTAFTLGPEFEGVPGGSIINRPWYVRESDLNVYSARANDANNAWLAEQLLFSYSGVVITSFDCAFEQNARFVIAAERPTGVAGAPEIWIYWYKPSVAAYVFENFGSGRNPQVVLDNPFETSNSDVLIGYLKDGSGFKIRVQSELYAVENSTPWISTTNWFLEELARLRGFRLGAFFSFHDVATGRYRIDRLESKLYPIYPQDGFNMGAKFFSGSSLVTAAIQHIARVEDAFNLGMSFFAGSTLVSIVITFTNYVDDAFNLGMSFFIGSTLTTVVIVHTAFVDDAFNMGLTFVAGSSLATIVIVHSQPVEDAFNMTTNLQGGTLAVP